MRLLLDTHAFIWLISDPARIPAAALEATRNPRNELFVSAISPFEIATKHRIGKFPDAQRVLLAYDDYLRQLRAEQLPITSHHGIVAGQLSWDHRDPFDRILAAQSITENMPLVTADKIFMTAGGVRTVWE